MHGKHFIILITFDLLQGLFPRFIFKSLKHIAGLAEKILYEIENLPNLVKLSTTPSFRNHLNQVILESKILLTKARSICVMNYVFIMELWDPADVNIF